MLEPAPTTVIDKHLARAVLQGVRQGTATTPPALTLKFLNTSYELDFEPKGGQLPAGIADRVGGLVIGTIRAVARRVDVIGTGGQFIDPVRGRPRRIQGRILEIDGAGGTITIDAGFPVVCRLSAHGQKPALFEPLQFVACDVLPGVSFELTE